MTMRQRLAGFFRGMRGHGDDALVLGGWVLLYAGMWRVDEALALMVSGLLLIVAGLLSAYGKRAKR